MKRTYRYISLTILFFVNVYAFSLPLSVSGVSSAGQVLLDHDWYLAGEKMTVAVEVPEAEKASKVAYVELCDADGLQTSVVLGLTDGRGQGVLELPSSLHSGYYVLNMYTRMGTKALQRLLPVVNIMQKHPNDDITWVDSTVTAPQPVSVSQSQYTPIPSDYLSLFSQRRENEGHCIYARVHRTADTKDYVLSQVNASLAIVGKELHLFDGKMLDDSTAVFNTYDVNGRHSIVIAAETFDKKPLSVEIINPFASISHYGESIPHLTFNYNRQEVERRSLEMQKAVGDTMVVDSTVFHGDIFSTKPIFSYNLDEYRQFRTIREVLLEYVQFVHRREKYGVPQLYVYNENIGYSDWSALVLLDGMPVADIDRLLKYDARRVHYISIYDDFYTFGNSLYKGVVNIVTRTGKLTNFPPEKTSAYLVYNFPQG